MKKTNLTIGITIGFNKEGKDQPYQLHANGLRQHIFFLADVLKEIDIVKNVYIVNCGEVSHKEQKFPKNFEDYGYVIKDLHEVENDLNVLIEMGMEVNFNKILKLKSKGTKIVGYGAGNSYVMMLEKMMFQDHKGEMSNKAYIFDEFWTNDQHMNTNKYYWEGIYKTKVKSLPHIWSSKFIDDDPVKFESLPDKPRVAIMEPNINVVKSFVYPLLICEHFYTQPGNRDKLQHVYVTNSFKFKEHATFKRFIKSLEIKQDNVASFEGRFKTYGFLKKYADIVVTHQWENGLNYLYYELLYLNYPLVHNSKFLKDVGYYYKDFDVPGGSTQLANVLTNHNKNKKDYNKACDEFLWEVNPKNPDVINTYKKAILGLK